MCVSCTSGSQTLEFVLLLFYNFIFSFNLRTFSSYNVSPLLKEEIISSYNVSPLLKEEINGKRGAKQAREFGNLYTILCTITNVYKH